MAERRRKGWSRTSKTDAGNAIRRASRLVRRARKAGIDIDGPSQILMGARAAMRSHRQKDALESARKAVDALKDKGWPPQLDHDVSGGPTLVAVPGTKPRPCHKGCGMPHEGFYHPKEKAPADAEENDTVSDRIEANLVMNVEGAESAVVRWTNALYFEIERSAPGKLIWPVSSLIPDHVLIVLSHWRDAYGAAMDARAKLAAYRDWLAATKR